MEHVSTTGRGVASTTGTIAIHHICFGEGDVIVRSNGVNNYDDKIVLPSYLLYQGRTTKKTKQNIPERCVVCFKSKRGSEGSRERDIHHVNATKQISQTFGAAKNFAPQNPEEGFKSTKYTDIQSEYVGNLAKIKLLEVRIMAYDMSDP